MTKQEMLRIMRLLSALEGLMMSKAPMPDYLIEQLDDAVAVLEREILKETPNA